MLSIGGESKIVKTDSLNSGKVTEIMVLRANSIVETGYCQALQFLSRTPLFCDDNNYYGQILLSVLTVETHRTLGPYCNLC